MVMHFCGLGLKETLDLDILSFAAICDSIDRVKAEEKLDALVVSNLAFNGGEEAEKAQKEWIEIVSGVPSNDASAFQAIIGKAF